MADKLNQSLDEILKDRRTARPAGRGPRGGRAVVKTTKTTVKTVAPANGIKKNLRNKPTQQVVAPTGPSGANGGSKIIVSNLPSDVTEPLIQDYFSKSVGPIKKTTLTYGPNGVSRGICTIIFSNAGGAAKAVKELNGIKVDQRPIKVEVVVGANQAPGSAPVKTLRERISQPKPATVTSKVQTKVANGKTGGGNKKGPSRGRNSNRRKPKTADELDAEMTDYFGGGVNGTDAANTNINTNGAGAMEDEIM